MASFFARHRGKLGLATAMFIAGIVFWGGFNTAMEATNTLSFCISCHEMRDNMYPDYVKSSHYSNPSGVRAICSDCHVPKQWVPKLIRKIRASNELWHWMIGTVNTPEKFEKRRLHLAQRVWAYMKESDSRECRNCHNFDTMDLKRQARFAARIHGDAKKEGKTCIDCHKGITHRLPKDMPKEKAVAEDTSKWTYDEEYADEIMMTCAPCHGPKGQGKPDGTYPRIAGLDPVYLARQLRAFKERKRVNIPMQPYTTERELPEEDVQTISLYLSRIKLPSRLGEIDKKNFDPLEVLERTKMVVNVPLWKRGNVEGGARAYRRECAGCHGPKGEGNPAKLIPPLAGQYSAYLKRQIRAFAEGKRVHDDPRDKEIFASVGEGEIDDILAWLSVQDD